MNIFQSFSAYQLYNVNNNIKLFYIINHFGLPKYLIRNLTEYSVIVHVI